MERSPDIKTQEQIIVREEMKVTEGFVKEVIYRKDPDLSGYLCKPESTGKLPAVIYNHGGTGDQIGGAPEETCKALKDAGYVGFSPIRRPDIRDDRDLNDIYSALDYLKTLDYVDTEKLGMIGFSRGGYLTYLTISGNSDFETAVILAAAPPRDKDGFYSRAKDIKIPVLLAVAENDLPAEQNKYKNLLESMTELNEEMKKAGVETSLTMYPPYRNNGHLMFFEILDYWKDIEEFLKDNL